MSYQLLMPDIHTQENIFPIAKTVGRDIHDKVRSLPCQRKGYSSFLTDSFITPTNHYGPFTIQIMSITCRTKSGPFEGVYALTNTIIDDNPLDQFSRFCQITIGSTCVALLELQGQRNIAVHIAGWAGICGSDCNRKESILELVELDDGFRKFDWTELADRGYFIVATKNQKAD